MSLPVTNVLVNLVVRIEVEVLIVGVSVVLLMMVLLVAGCTVEVADTNKLAGADEVVRTVELVATVKVVGIVEVVEVLGTDVNGRDIIDEVVNTVDMSDTDDE